MPPFEEPDPLETLKGVSRVALKKVTTQSPEEARDPVFRRPLETYIGQMLEAVLDRDQTALRSFVGVMQKAMITRAHIAEVYVPIVARRLGDAWVEDRLDFGAVTIGAARLQGLLHHLGAEWSDLQGTVSGKAQNMPLFQSYSRLGQAHRPEHDPRHRAQNHPFPKKGAAF